MTPCIKYWLLYPLNTYVQGRLAVRTPTRKRDFLFYTRVQNVPEAHATSGTVGKEAGAWVLDLPPISFSSEVQTGYSFTSAIRLPLKACCMGRFAVLCVCGSCHVPGDMCRTLIAKAQIRTQARPYEIPDQSSTETRLS